MEMSGAPGLALEYTRREGCVDVVFGGDVVDNLSSMNKCIGCFERGEGASYYFILVHMISFVCGVPSVSSYLPRGTFRVISLQLDVVCNNTLCNLL